MTDSTALLPQAQDREVRQNPPVPGPAREFAGEFIGTLVLFTAVTLASAEYPVSLASGPLTVGVVVFFATLHATYFAQESALTAFNPAVVFACFLRQTRRAADNNPVPRPTLARWFIYLSAEALAGIASGALCLALLGKDDLKMAQPRASVSYARGIAWEALGTAALALHFCKMYARSASWPHTYASSVAWRALMFAPAPALLSMLAAGRTGGIFNVARYLGVALFTQEMAAKDAAVQLAGFAVSLVVIAAVVLGTRFMDPASDESPYLKGDLLQDGERGAAPLARSRRPGALKRF